MLPAADAARGREGHFGLSRRPLQRSAWLQPDRLHQHHAGDSFRSKTRMIEVDTFDLKMLAALQDDGRLTNQQLADRIGLSASQCSRRRMRLEEEKVISGYHADLSSEALGFNLIAFINITLATHSDRKHA